MTRPYYHKRHRNNNGKIVVIVGLVAVSVFALTMILYPQISTQTNKIQTSLVSESKTITNTITSPATNNNVKSIPLQIHDLVNQQRTQAGLSALTWSDNLAQIAQTHSNDMLSSGDFSHSGLDQRLEQMGCPSGSENIEVSNGYYIDQVPRVAVNDWMNSYGHRQNVLSGSFTSEGIGIAQDGNRVLITEDFC